MHLLKRIICQTVNRCSSSSLRIVQSIVQTEGAKALYRGCGVNIVGNSASWSIYFVLYARIKDTIELYRGPLSYYDFFIASGSAGMCAVGIRSCHQAILTKTQGILTALATNPIWVIKTRMLSRPSGHAGAYTSMLDGARQIVRQEGFRGFYRGLLPSLFGVSHGALQFMTYEQLKIYKSTSSVEGSKDLTAIDFLMLSGVAKVFAGSATYPYQVVRTRLQMYDADSTYRSATDVVTKVWRTEGIAGFYRGLGPNLLRVLPSTWVTFLVYEKTKMYIPRMLNQRETGG